MRPGRAQERRRRRTTLAVHPGALGDVILFGQMLGRLSGAVTLLAGREKGALLAGLGAVDGAMDFEAVPMHEVFSDRPISECRLPAILGEHDRLISCFAGGNRAAELRLSAMCSAKDSAFLPVRPEAAAAGHLLDLWAGMLGMTVSPGGEGVADTHRWGGVAWKTPASWREAARAALTACGVKGHEAPLVIHPGAGAPRKCWRLENFVALARRGLAGGDACPAVVFVLGPAEMERWNKDRIAEIGREFPLLVCPPLRVLAGVLAGAAGLVGNDSGVCHLAAALGTRTVSLFGATCVDHFAPCGPAVTTIAADSMEEISVEGVAKRLWRS